MNIEEFLKSIKNNENVILVFHNDADGICSAVLMKKYLKTKNIEPYLISQPMPVDENLIDKIKLSVPDKIIFLDLAIDQHINVLKELKTIARVAIIDHHIITTDMNNHGIVHYNPRFTNPNIYQSCGYLVYKILSGITDMKKFLWISAVAITADYELKDSADLIEKIQEQYNVADLYQSDIGRVVDMISAVRATKKMSSENIVEVIDKSDSVEDVLKNHELMKSYRLITNEINGILVDAKAYTEQHGNIIFYELKTDYNIKSQIATELSKKNPDSLVVVYQRKGGKIKLSVRNQTSRFNVSELLKTASKSLNATAGGHENAGGGVVSVNDWDNFKNNLKMLVK